MASSARTTFTTAFILAAFAASTMTVPSAAAEGPGDTAMGSQIAKHEGTSTERSRTAEAPAPVEGVPGIDVSGHQGEVNWRVHWDNGVRFSYVKATEGTGFRNKWFAQQYNGSFDVGMIRGAYHFALPDRSSGADQANFFVDNGGGWSADGRTLPGALDIEYNPYSEDKCYGLDHHRMADWLKDFSDTYHHRTGRYPTIYTSTSWWSMCTGERGADFRFANPLWVARYAAELGRLPHAWGTHTIWQYSSTPIDQNAFNGAYDRLQALAFG